jgi:hypothetical protein
MQHVLIPFFALQLLLNAIETFKANVVLVLGQASDALLCSCEQ